MLSGRSYEGVWEASHRNTIPGVSPEDMFGAMDKVQSHDEETQGSGSGSGFSDLSALENETDEFGRQLLQHHRDAARLQALRGNQQPVRKSIPRARIAGVLGRETRDGRLQEMQDLQRVGSGGSQDSDPPVTVPREWGRKARRQKDWMKKILDPSEPSENGDEVDCDGDSAIFTRKTAFTGNRDKPTSATEPIQSVEQTPPAANKHQPSTPPSSMRHMNTTLRPSTDSEDAEFSAMSLLTSTPAKTRIPRRIDELARREIEDLEQQEVTSRALEEIEHHSPNGTLRRTSSSKLRRLAEAGILPPTSRYSSRPATASGTSETSSRIPRRRRSPDRNQENIPPNSGTSAAQVDRDHPEAGRLHDRANQAVNIGNSHRSGHQRNDSMNLLRKLARVSSMSPNPAIDKRKDVAVDDQQIEDAPTAPSLRARFGELRNKRPAKQAENGSSAQPLQEQVKAEVDESPLQPDSPSDAKTPAVTGAWVDTILQSDDPVRENTVNPESDLKRSESTGTVEEDEELRRVKSEPARPKSALAEILRESRDENQEQLFGESTIQSLEDIVNPDTDQTDPTITFDLNAVTADEGHDDGAPLTQEEKNRRQESLAIEGLNKHLRAARTNIKDASRGLRRVENSIHTVHETELPLVAGTITSDLTHHKPGKHGFNACETCGGRYRSVWYALWAELCSCFYTWDQTYRYRIRFTSFGLFCAIWLTWYIVECTLCEIYCQKFWTRQRFYTPDWRAPRFPFVIPTLLFRPIFYLFMGVDAYDEVWREIGIWWEKEVFERFISGGDPCFGMHPATCVPQSVRLARAAKAAAKTTVRSAVSSLKPSRNEWVAAAAATGARVVGSFVDAVDDVGSMWDDAIVS